MNRVILTTPNDVPLDVALLHRILAVHDSGVTQEIAKRLADPETTEKVRILQAQLGVPPDKRRIIDQPTALALERPLEEQGSVESTHSFTVSSQVQWTAGTHGRQQRLFSCDLDLRAVGAAKMPLNKRLQLAEIGSLGRLGPAPTEQRWLWIDVQRRSRWSLN
jgi:hypothetical protein